jgi:hypothetical protein
VSLSHDDLLEDLRAASEERGLDPNLLKLLLTHFDLERRPSLMDEEDSRAGPPEFYYPH